MKTFNVFGFANRNSSVNKFSQPRVASRQLRSGTIYDLLGESVRTILGAIVQSRIPIKTSGDFSPPEVDITNQTANQLVLVLGKR